MCEQTHDRPNETKIQTNRKERAMLSQNTALLFIYKNHFVDQKYSKFLFKMNWFFWLISFSLEKKESSIAHYCCCCLPACIFEFLFYLSVLRFSSMFVYVCVCMRAVSILLFVVKLFFISKLNEISSGCCRDSSKFFVCLLCILFQLCIVLHLWSKNEVVFFFVCC